MAYLLPAEFPAVRAAIGTDVDDRSLPDSIIDMSIYRGTAENWLAALDAALATHWLNSTLKPRITAALVLKTASLIVTALPFLLSEDWKDQSFSRQAVDTEALAATLNSRALTEVAGYLEAAGTTPPESATGLTHFTLARGTRGQ